MQPEEQRAGDGSLYTKRAATDSNEGRRAAASCPCLVLLVVYDDETFDGDVTRHMLCPSCAAGWVREVPCPQTLASVHVLCREAAPSRLKSRDSAPE